MPGSDDYTSNQSATLRAMTATSTMQPNFIIIQGEDAGRALSCYGDPDARTPCLDALAADGCRYDQAFSTAPVCAPSRSTMATGRYAWSMGTHAMRSTLLDAPRTFTESLREAGYYVDWADKTDFNFEPREGHADRLLGHRDTWIEALRNDRLSDAPFCLYANLSVTHESTMWGPAEDRGGAVEERIAREPSLPSEQRVSPDAVRVPAYLPDTLETRTDIARFYEAVAIMDQQAGTILDALRESRHSDNTYVIFLTDHGRGLPREKRWCYGAGLHLSFLVKGPDIAPGTQSDRLISWVDLAPTVLSLAGLPLPADYEGRAFLGPQEAAARDTVFAGRDRMDECFDRVRVARDARYHYIRNDFPEIPYAQRLHYMETMGSMKVLRSRHAHGQLDARTGVFMQSTKPAEELYDTQTDPDMVQNLAADPAHAQTLHRLRDRLRELEGEIPDLGRRRERELVEDGIVANRLEEYRERLRPLPEAYALGDHRDGILEMPGSETRPSGPSGPPSA